MAKLIVLNLEKEELINVLSVSNIGLGEEPSRESVEAFYPCRITWCPKYIDKHIAEESSDLQCSDSVYINSYSQNDLTPGLYHRITKHKNHFLIEKTSA